MTGRRGRPDCGCIQDYSETISGWRGYPPLDGEALAEPYRSVSKGMASYGRLLPSMAHREVRPPAAALSLQRSRLLNLKKILQLAIKKRRLMG
jgi:hypothetical protein